MYKFPKSVALNIVKADKGGHDWQIVSTGAYSIIVEGWSDGTKRDARKEAWYAAEQVGLVCDE